jgi:hypothetical protein
MFTKICNMWSNDYPLFDITKYIVDRVISLNILTHSWMWWCFSFISIILISSLIIALILASIISFIIFFMIILIKTLCGWSSTIWESFLRLITWILWPYISNQHSLYSITWGFFIIYKIKINLLLLKAISLIKHRITHSFNTTGGHIENTVCARVWIIIK